MAVFAMTNCDLYTSGLDLSGVSNKLTVAATAQQLDATTFGSGGYISRIGGLQDVTISHEGFGDFVGTLNDSTMFGNLGLSGLVTTVAPQGTDGDTAYFAQGLRADYKPLDGQVGQLAQMSGTLTGSLRTGLVRGLIMFPKTSLSAPVSGTIQNLGAVTAGQSVYAALHVFTAGTTVTVQVQSAATGGFGSPTTRATFSGITTVSGNWASTAGPITDAFWRINVSAVTGTFVLAATIGIR